MEAELEVAALSPAQFCERVGPFLAEREAENGLPWGTALRLMTAGNGGNRSLLFSIEAAGRVLGASVWTPPYDVVVTRLPSGAARVLASRCLESGFSVSGTMGPEGSGLELARELARLTGSGVSVRKRQRVYELLAVNPVSRSRGTMRLANGQDLDLVVDWCTEFRRETGLPSHKSALAWATESIDSASVFLWVVEDEVTSLAGLSRETPNGRSIGPVYTPPHARNQGFATSLVAALSERVLSSGKRFAVLFTDTANPTSNHIYEAIGFRRICDYDAFSLTPPG